MFDNVTYDIMSQLVEEHRSLWRLKGSYQQDCSGNQQCAALWSKLIDEKERQIGELENLLRSQLETGQMRRAA